ncbi:MAG TPA: aminodeoxychorismate/anthranilate synthase component II [Cryomorphaceae bacterium]|nr:aminodeoxychorismate/anthranilate synthase component II [Cryomorphaceae bacterium]HBB80922.1 aminodeoxychorismate/anthranilate synthase component II [Cryomorphaceae bacterium]|tara:strand:+ start:6751 stop:7344 length:594 start_codon:yes stop_codon:yes gene_type:complete
MKVLLIDNYDSFTYNLVHYLEELDCEVTVLRNDSSALNELDLSMFHGLVLSPGPGLPENNGILMDIASKALGTIPLLGVCLGMQALGILAGSSLYNRNGVMHGRTAKLQKVANDGILLNGVKSLTVGLYHSWAVKTEGLGPQWKVCAVALDDDAPMVIENIADHAFGVQFHPESILTNQGKLMMKNWVDYVRNIKAY